MGFVRRRGQDNLLKGEPREFIDFEEMLVEVLDKEVKVI